MSSTPAAAESNPLAFVTENPVSSALSSLHASFRDRRQKLGLKNPGTVENVSREVLKDVFLNNHTFSGMRADLMKSFSVNPVFQISHAFTMGAQGLPPYTFAAVFGNDKVGSAPQALYLQVEKLSCISSPDCLGRADADALDLYASQCGQRWPGFRQV